jgi:hypothetical protein
MVTNDLDEMKRQFPKHVLDRRDDVLRLLNEAIASGDQKAVGEYRKHLRKYDKTIAEYGFKRHA